MWVSLRLVLIGAIVGTLLGVAAGAYGAVKQYRLVRPPADDVLVRRRCRFPRSCSAVLFKNAGIGLNNVLGFTGDTKLLYTTGEITPGLDPWSWAGIVNRLAHLVLPSLVLIVVAVAFYGRYQRNAMLDVLGSDFLRTAQAKGLRRSRALIKHGLRTALIPMATFFAYEFALLFVGATFTEKIFGWHGMGEYFVDSVTKNDVNSVAGVTLFVAVLVLIAGFLSDVAYAALDPAGARVVTAWLTPPDREPAGRSEPGAIASEAAASRVATRLAALPAPAARAGRPRRSCCCSSRSRT